MDVGGRQPTVKIGAGAADARRPGAARPASRVTSPLTLTKFAPPPLPARLAGAERLRAWADKVSGRLLTVVRAPSGFGKTTFCASLYRQFEARGDKVAWVSFDRDDDEPVRVLSYIGRALDSVAPGVADEAQAQLHDDTMVPVQTLAAMLVNALLTDDRPFVLFLDDVDRINDSQSLQFLTYIILHAPPRLRIVLSCQAKPRLPLSYLEAHDALLRVETDDLRLRAEETRALLGDLADLSLEDIDGLQEAMGGWVTGLKIGSIALRHNRESMLDIGLVATGAQWLGDYLEENILRYLPAKIQQFLIRCSVAEQLTAELCMHLSGVSQAQEFLEWLADQNLFVQPLDPSGSWFRLHPVFREFLIAQLRRQTPELEISLHRQAARWFADHRLLPQAIRHALEAGDSHTAVDWVEQSAMSMVEQSDIMTLLGWIARLPPAAIQHRTRLRIAEAWALTLTLRPRAREVLAELDSMRMAHSGDDGELAREILGVRAIYMGVYEDRGDDAMRLARLYLSERSDEDSFTTRAVRNAAAWCYSEAGDHEQARVLLRPAQLVDAKREQLFTMAYRQCILGHGFAMEGHLADAERTFRAAVTRCERQVGRRSASATLAACFLAQSLYERNALTEAEEVLYNRFAIIDEACFHEAVITAYNTAIRQRLAVGDRAGAATLIERAELIGHERNWRRLLALCTSLRVRHNFPQVLDPFADFPLGDVPLQELKPLSDAARLLPLLIEAHVLRYLDKADIASAEATIAAGLRLAESARHVGEAIRVRLLHAHILERAERLADATTVTAGVLNLAVQHGFFRSIVDTAPVASIERLRGNPDGLTDEAVDLLHQVHAAMSTSSAMGLDSVVRPADANVFTLLTAREIDVLSGVAEGLSNKEVARRIHLTPETVKWHMKNIMKKLNAENRAQAVSRATAIGLDFH